VSTRRVVIALACGLAACALLLLLRHDRAPDVPPGGDALSGSRPEATQANADLSPPAREGPGSPAGAARSDLRLVPDLRVQLRPTSSLARIEGARMIVQRGSLTPGLVANALRVVRAGTEPLRSFDSAGRAEVGGLEPGPWTVLAASPTAMAEPAEVEIRAGSPAELELELAPVVGAAVRFEHELGGPPRLADADGAMNTWLELVPAPEFLASGWRAFSPAPVLSALAGVDAALLDRSNAEFLVFYRGGRGAPTEGALIARARSLVYRTFEGGVSALPPAQLQGYRTIALERRVAECSLELRVLGSGVCELPSTATPPHAWMQLAPRDDRRSEGKQPVLIPDSASRTLTDIPAGRYRVVGGALFERLLKRQPSVDLTLIGDQQNVLELDARGLGCLVVEPVGRDGAPFTAALQLRLTADRGLWESGRLYLEVTRPPYTIPFLEPGTYRIDVIPKEGSARTHVEATCVADASVTVKATLAP